MKGVLPSPELKALVRTKQDTCFVLFFVFARSGCVGRSVCIVTMHPEREKDSLWLVFFPQQPTPLRLHRGLKEILVLELDEADAEMKTRCDKCVRKEKWIERDISFPIYWSKWLCWLWNLFSCLSFIYFWLLNGGNESVLHSSISVLKSFLSHVLITSWMSTSILSRSCLAHLMSVCWHVLFFSFIRDANITID